MREHPNANVKWSMNHERCRCKCAMHIVIEHLHLHRSWFMDHLTFAFEKLDQKVL
jgi:hypothetical protein